MHTHSVTTTTGYTADMMILDDTISCKTLPCTEHSLAQQARIDYYKNRMNDFVDCPPPCAPTTPKKTWGCKIKKDENPMNSYASATLVTAADTTLADERRFLRHELSDAFEKAKLTLKRQFGLEDDEAPMTLDETIKRIQDGLFVIPEKYKDQKTYGSLGYLRWRDPKAVEDKAGYKAARVTLDAEYSKAERIIKILTPQEGLQAVIDFEAAQTPAAK